MLRSLLRALGIMLALGAPVHAQGTLPITLTQQFAFTACSTTTTICGTPLIGGLLYFYQAGTVATPQQSYQDTGLSILNPWPLVLDSNGRVPAFYLANGSVHVRLTDANGIVQFDYANMLVIGPSSGSGGGSSVDPTTISSTGDIKFRLTGETVTGWTKLNGLTIGNAVSGATGRANADTLNLFVYEWTNCIDAHCPVVGGRGSSGLADFNANKQLMLPDLRDSIPVGLDDMGNIAKGGLLPGNITSGGGDGVTTPMASGGAANQSILQTHLPDYVLPDPGHSHFLFPGNATEYVGTGFQNFGNAGSLASAPSAPLGINISQPATTGVHLGGSAALFPVMNPFKLGSWYIKL